MRARTILALRELAKRKSGRIKAERIDKRAAHEVRSLGVALTYSPADRHYHFDHEAIRGLYADCV